MSAQLRDIDVARYNYRPESDPQQRPKLGFIAEDMPEELRSSNGKGVDLDRLVAFTIGALKTPQKRIDALEAELAAKGVSPIPAHPLGQDEQLVQRGNELLRTLLETHLNDVADVDFNEPILDTDEVLQTHWRGFRRTLETRFGRMELGRQGMNARGSLGLVPTDAHLNLPLEAFSYPVQSQATQAWTSSLRPTTIVLCSERREHIWPAAGGIHGPAVTFWRTRSKAEISARPV